MDTVNEIDASIYAADDEDSGSSEDEQETVVLEGESILEEPQVFPDAIENDSDGTTLVLHERPATIPHPRQNEVPPEEFATAEPHPQLARSLPSGPASPPAPNETTRSAGLADHREQRQRLLLIVLASYASAVTLALLFLLFLRNSEPPHHLESLPDLAPDPEGELSYVPLDTELPPGHTLHLGESQRFGNLLVEPLRITREPIEFVHYSGEPEHARPPSAPVWKLWVRFTNVAEDQVFTALDRRLLFRWVLKDGQEYSNHYLFQPQDDRSEAIHMYSLPVASDWDMKGQTLGQSLQPGTSTDTYIATDTLISEPQGELLWRVQIRKGLSSAGNGVTTLFEVVFHSEEVADGTHS